MMIWKFQSFLKLEDSEHLKLKHFAIFICSFCLMYKLNIKLVVGFKLSELKPMQSIIAANVYLSDRSPCARKLTIFCGNENNHVPRIRDFLHVCWSNVGQCTRLQCICWAGLMIDSVRKYRKVRKIFWFVSELCWGCS